MPKGSDVGNSEISLFTRLIPMTSSLNDGDDLRPRPLQYAKRFPLKSTHWHFSFEEQLDASIVRKTYPMTSACMINNILFNSENSTKRKCSSDTKYEIGFHRIKETNS